MDQDTSLVIQMTWSYHPLTQLPRVTLTYTDPAGELSATFRSSVSLTSGWWPPQNCLQRPKPRSVPWARCLDSIHSAAASSALFIQHAAPVIREQWNKTSYAGITCFLKTPTRSSAYSFRCSPTRLSLHRSAPIEFRSRQWLKLLTTALCHYDISLIVT